MKKIYLAAIFLLTLGMACAQTVDPLFAKGGRGPRYLITTNMGDILVELNPLTPKHTQNFQRLVEEHTYDSLLFHRVIKDFMVQAGDPRSRRAARGQRLGDGTLGYTVPAEINSTLYHRRGALCAARMGDQVNPARESSASQFYIVQGRTWSSDELDLIEKRTNHHFLPEQRAVYEKEGGTPFLDGQYTVFGYVVSGMEVVDAIAGVATDPNDRPKQDVRIISIVKVK